MCISKYIRENEKLKSFDFITVFSVIVTLMEDGRLIWDFDDDV